MFVKPFIDASVELCKADVILPSETRRDMSDPYGKALY
jgi:hypothetical protein